MMPILQRITERARKYGVRPEEKGLYDHHPELTERIPLLRVYSDQADTGGVSSMTDFYLSNVWVHKAITAIANNLAGLDVRVVRGQGQDAEPLDNHPVTQLLSNPNPETGPADLWREWVIDMMLSGEHGLEAAENGRGSAILELWPREPQHFSVIPGELGRRYRRVSGYKVDDNEGPAYTLTAEQLIHFKFYNPANPWRGLAPIYAVRTGIVIDQLAQAWTRLFFRNQARPDFAVIAPEGITKSEKADIILELDQNVGGGEGLHRPIVLEQGVTDIKVFSFPPKDLEWIEQRKLSREEIGSIFGVPDEIMGWGRDTYENFDTADRVLWTLTIVPLAGMRDHALTRYFRRRKAINPDERIETDLANVPQLQENITEKVNQFNVLTGRGIPANVAKDSIGLNLPDLEGGDVGYQPFSMVPVLRKPGTKPPPAPPAPDDDGKGLKRKSILEYGSAAHEQIWKAKQARLTPDVNSMQRVVKKLIQEQQNRVVRRLRDSRTFGRGQYKQEGNIPPVNELFDPVEEIALWIAGLKKTVTTAVLRIGQSELDELGIELVFDVTRPEVQAGIRQVLEAVATKTNNTTWNDLIELFQEAEREGEGIPAIQERLSAYFGDRKSDFQTERIARTTMTGSSNFGSVEAWKQSEVVDGHTWISALIPGRTREDHALAHGQTVRLGQMFTVGGESMQFPGDPAASAGNIINCLCTTVANVMEQ